MFMIGHTSSLRGDAYVLHCYALREMLTVSMRIPGDRPGASREAMVMLRRRY